MPLHRVRKYRRRLTPKEQQQVQMGVAIIATMIVVGLTLIWMRHARLRVRIHVERVAPAPLPIPPARQAASNAVIMGSVTSNPPPTPVPVPTPTPLPVEATTHHAPATIPPPPQPIPQPRPPVPSPPPAFTNVGAIPRLNLQTNQLAILRAQISLDRLAISAGSIDGKLGRQTRAALRSFQVQEGLASTGELDAPTRMRLTLAPPVFMTERITVEDIAKLHPLATNWYGKSLQTALAHETILESMAEKHHAHPNLMMRLNPEINWDSPQPGTLILAPSVKRKVPEAKAALIRIRLADRTMDVFDAANNLLAHFPCSIAQQIEKRPVGELHIAVIATDPDYTFDPAVFPESAEARQLGRKLILEPGPNNPVGTVWMGLNKPGYGIHGTPKPEDVGRTESKGCFRLANWNVEYLVKIVTTGPAGTVIRVEP